MRWYLQTWLVALRRRVPTSFIHRGRLAVALLLAVLAHGCTGLPPAPVAGPDPSDPRVRTPSATYSSPFGSYVSRRPVEPASWRQLNEQVAPQPKQ
jgi:hypothetical protein